MARFLRTLLFGVTTVDVPTFAVTALLLALVAAGAATLPALGATRVDPNVALRAD
jgi:hypothetical protein